MIKLINILKNIFAACFGLLLTLIIIEAFLRVNPNFVYYRPFEMLAMYDEGLGHMVFKKNTAVRVLMPYGDLVATSYKLKPIDQEPRKVLFKVDSYGFRNNKDYSGQKYILVGDSFVFGAGDSQEDILSSQLKDKYNIDAYNVAFTGNLFHYVKFIKEFQKRHNSDFKVILFFFEGNDFEINPPEDFGRNYPYQFIRNTYIYRLLKTKYYFIRDRYYVKENRNVDKVLSIKIAGQNVGFYKPRVDLTREVNFAGSQEFENALKSISDKIVCIYFIPEKYRVYYEFIEPKNKDKLPNVRWEYLSSLANKFNLKITDLTPYLVEESRKRLREDKTFTWWKDDTHWNKYGIGVAAKAVADTLHN